MSNLINDEILKDKTVYKRYRIAGLKVAMYALGDRNINQSKPYLDDEEWDIDDADVYLNMTSSDYDKYVSDYPDSDLDIAEYMIIGTKFYRQLIMHGGMMVHASAVVTDGYAFLFSADSGTGKSTHTSLWLKNLKDKAFIINDDKPAIIKEDGEWFVYGTPWSGKTDMNVNTKAKLGGIVFIERGEENIIERISPKDATGKLFKQTVRKIIKMRMEKLLDIMDELLREVRVYKLKADMSDNAFLVSYNKLIGDTKENDKEMAGGLNED